MKKRFLFFAAVLMATTMMANAADSQVTNADNVEANKVKNEYTDWHKWLDYINIVKPLAIEQYNTLYLRPIDASAVVWPDKTDNQYDGLKNALEALPGIIKENIEKKYSHLKVVVIDDQQQIAADDKALILRLKIEELDMGNRALRVWVGFGAGHQSVAISGDVTDANGEPFFNFRHRRISNNWQTYEKILKTEFKNFSKDICRIFKEL